MKEHPGCTYQCRAISLVRRVPLGQDLAHLYINDQASGVWMRMHAGWVCAVLFATPLLLVVPLSLAVQFTDFPRAWALGLIALSVPFYAVFSRKAVPRPSENATSPESSLLRTAGSRSARDSSTVRAQTSTPPTPAHR